MLTAVAINIAPLAMLVLYLLPHREHRFERLFIATIGALVGSLIGRVLVNPSTMGHVAFVAGGAVLFAGVDWLRRTSRSTGSRA
jgi:hypothetical protein